VTILDGPWGEGYRPQSQKTDDLHFSEPPLKSDMALVCTHQTRQSQTVSRFSRLHGPTTLYLKALQQKHQAKFLVFQRCPVSYAFLTSSNSRQKLPHGGQRRFSNAPNEGCSTTLYCASSSKLAVIHVPQKPLSPSTNCSSSGTAPAQLIISRERERADHGRQSISLRCRHPRQQLATTILPTDH
jgi:hypothetical protein